MYATCVSCPEGEYLDESSQLCRYKECTCSNGIPNLGLKCLQHNIESCQSCAPGYSTKAVISNSEYPDASVSVKGLMSEKVVSFLGQRR